MLGKLVRIAIGMFMFMMCCGPAIADIVLEPGNSPAIADPSGSLDGAYAAAAAVGGLVHLKIK